jgi:hypothetical protein
MNKYVETQTWIACAVAAVVAAVLPTLVDAAVTVTPLVA